MSTREVIWGQTVVKVKRLGTYSGRIEYCAEVVRGSTPCDGDLLKICDGLLPRQKIPFGDVRRIKSFFNPRPHFYVTIFTD